MKTLNIYILELKEFLVDIKFNLLIFIIMPFVISFLNGIFYSNIFDPYKALPSFKVVLFDKDKGNYSKSLENLLTSDKLKKVIDLKLENSPLAIDNDLINGVISVAIMIPPNFSMSVESGSTTSIEVKKAPSAGVNGEIIQNIITSYTQFISINKEVYRAINDSTKDTALTERLYQELLPQIIKLSSNNYVVSGSIDTVKKVSSKQYYAFSMFIMFSLFLITVGAGNILKERDNSTLLRLKSTKLNKLSFLAGKLLAIISFFLVLITAFIFLTKSVSGISWGNSTTNLIVVILVHCISISGLSILCGSLFKSQKTMRSALTFIIMLMSFLGGSFFPTESTGKVMDFIAHFTINYWLEKCYMGTMLGNPLTSIYSGLLILISIGIGSIVISSLIFKFEKSEVV